MEGDTKRPLRTKEEAQEYFIRCMLAVPACVWEAFDGLRIVSVLKILSKCVRRYPPSANPINQKMNRRLRMHQMPEQDEYLAYQIHMGGTDIPGNHILAIATLHWESLLTWDPSIKLPIFDINDARSSMDIYDWNAWRKKQRGLMFPRREAIKAMSAPARHFREATLKGLRVIHIDTRGIHWEVDNVPISMGKERIQSHFANGIPPRDTPSNTSPDPGQGESSDRQDERKNAGSQHEPGSSNNEAALPTPSSKGSAPNDDNISEQCQDPAPFQPSDTTPERETRSPSPQRQSTPPQQSEQVSTEPLGPAVSALVGAMERLTDTLGKQGVIMKADRQQSRDGGKGTEDDMRALGADLAAGIRKTIKKAVRKEMKRMERKQSGVRKRRRR